MDDEQSARAWAASGVMALTGPAAAPPLLGPPSVPDRLSALAAAVSASTGEAVRPRWGELLSGRAALLGTRRRGRTSPGGSCRLLRAGDGGWAAVNLPRREDVASVEAMTGVPVDEGPWATVERWVAEVAVGDVVERAALLGIPASALTRPRSADRPVIVERRWPTADARPPNRLRVVDLSSMWAGPLATRLLAAAGAQVIKVEGAGRPDGARATPDVYRWLHPPGQKSVTVDLGDNAGRRTLRALLESADIVVEGSRPRALEQLGCSPDDLPARSGRVWLSITGHGRSASGRDRVGFGDDAAVAGGLVAWEATGEPTFCGDAIADPITGLAGAAAVLEAVAAGGGVLLDAALARVAAWTAASPAWGQPGRWTAQTTAAGGWELDLPTVTVPVADPLLPTGW